MLLRGSRLGQVMFLFWCFISCSSDGGGVDYSFLCCEKSCSHSILFFSMRNWKKFEVQFRSGEERKREWHRDEELIRVTVAFGLVRVR